MLTRIEKLEKIQNEASQNLVKKRYATIEVATGVGKTFISFKAAYLVKEKAEKHFNKSYRPTVLFLAETNIRYGTLLEEIKKFKELFGKDFKKDFKITFACYQARTQNKKFDIIIADEVHDGLTPKYAVFLKNEANYIFGLSAYIPDTPFNRESLEGYTKIDFINENLPICYKYSLVEAIEDGILSDFELIVVDHQLDDTKKTVQEKKKRGVSRNFKKYTEREYFEETQDKINHYAALIEEAELRGDGKSEAKYTYLKQQYNLELVRLLWQLPSKKDIVNKILKENKDKKTIVFGTSLNLLESITKKTVSSRRSKELNASYINAFNKDKIKLIGSFKMLKQGITLEGVEICILASYYSQLKDFLQEIGRIVRFKEGKKSKVYIIVTNNTLENKWCREILNIKTNGKQ